ncbi:MAG: hypothetical protein AB1585_17660 [Thermodesulfobacteriota bacterium]
MYTLVRTIGLIPGPATEAFQVALEITEYLNKNYSTNLKVFIPIFTTLSKVAWIGNYENLSIIEEINRKLRTDQGYWALVAKMGEKVIEGSGKDELFQSL